METLATWWADHQPALRCLDPAERAAAIVAKDSAKARLAPPPRAQPPPAVVLPARRPWPADTGRLL